MTISSDGFQPLEVYWVITTEYQCHACAISFDYRSGGYELVKLEEVGGTEERWLPTFGPGGYLDLLRQLVPEFNPLSEIRPAITKSFDEKFAPYQVRSREGNSFSVARGPVCPSCGSKDLSSVKEAVALAPPVEWMAYTCVPGAGV